MLGLKGRIEVWKNRYLVCKVKDKNGKSVRKRIYDDRCGRRNRNTLEYTRYEVMKKEEKTNVMRVLDGKKISYESHSYEPDATMSGKEIAGILGEDSKKVFKTLVTQGKSGAYYVFVVPVDDELNLKKAAKISGEKAISMIKQKELLPLTGYVHGGCSPIGMKKQFPTFIHETAIGFDKVFVSAGKVGYQIELSPENLISVAGCTVADII